MYILKKFFVLSGIAVFLLGSAQLLDISNKGLFAASIIGIVTDENGDAIEDATAVVKSNKTSGKRQTNKTIFTDSEGSFEVDKLKKGKYKITVKSVGYETVSEVVKISENSEELEENFTLDFSTYTRTNDTDAMDAAVSAYSEIGTLRKAEPIDGNAIASAYQGELQDLAKEIDEEYSLTLDSDISDAIEDVKKDTEPKLAAQVIDKTLQRVFYLAILSRITDVRDDFDDKDTSALSPLWDEAYAAYQAIVGTADRENKVLTSDRLNIETGSNPNLEDRITVAFIRGQDALNKNDPEEDEISIGVQRQVIRLSLIRAFYIAVLREVEGVLDNRDSDAEDAEVAQKEGEIYYKIIEEYISRDNPLGSETIKSQLSGDLSEVVADTIVSELSMGFIGRVEGELEENEESLSENDRGDAMILAEEALRYAEVFLDDLELRLDAGDRDEIEDALHDLRDASDSLNISGADTARQTITEMINNYENELL